MVGYKGYLIVGHAVRVPPTSSNSWRSQGNVFTETAEGGPILVKSLEGVIFESQRAAQDHGLELCKEWVDGNLIAAMMSKKVT